jgi:ketosteroid isomerase-like protein
MKKAIVVVPMLAAVLALAGWQKSAYAAEKGTDGAAAGGGVEATIMKLNDKIRAASLKGDAATIKDLYAEDFVSVSAITGAPSTKADLIENLKSGKLKYDSIDVSDAKVHMYGPTMALVTTKAEVKGKLGDQDISGTYRSSRLFVKRGGKWQVVFFQSTKVPTQMRTG